MFFPAAMTRLTWILPQSQLAESLERLAASGAFQPIDQRSLGQGTDAEPLRQALEEARRRAPLSRAARLLDPIPDQPLLHYRVGPLSGEGHAPAPPLASDGELYLCVSSTTEGKEAPEDPGPTAPPPPRLELLLRTADKVGRVADWAIIDGWVPTRELPRLRPLLENACYTLTPAEESGLDYHQVPSLFRRPRLLQGFAALMRLYGTTGYRELDPTPLLTVSFTLMFGMMFADLGQGLLLAGFGLWLYRRPAPPDAPVRQAGLLLMPVGLSAALFGILFGSAFAMEEWIPPLIHHPMDEVFLSLGISVAIGAGVLCLGMAIGLFNAWRSGRLDERRWEDYGPVGLLFYLSLVGLALSLWQEWTAITYTLATLALGCLLAVLVHHAREPSGQPWGLRVFQALLETYDFVIKFLVQTLSFVRLAAFTFAHIALSKALIVIVELLGHHPWLAAAVFVLGNLLIAGVEGLLVSIQVVRLHFFEMFTKFTSGGGRPFQPLEPTRMAT